MANEPTVGSLRWRVRLARRRQSPDAGSGIDERFEGLTAAWASVEAIGALTFWGAQQADSPVTHRIILRWVDYLDNTWVVLRTTKGPVAFRSEVFRVRRVSEWAGRKRWTVLECELEEVA